MKRLAQRWLPCGARAELALSGLVLVACQQDSSSPPLAPESSKVRITFPSTAATISVSQTSVQLAGWASIDAWSYAQEVEPNVRWYNATTSMQSEALEHVEWVWLFGWFPTDHTWQADVPLASGWNEVRIEAYYSGSGTVIGSDSIRVHAP